MQIIFLKSFCNVIKLLLHDYLIHRGQNFDLKPRSHGNAIGPFHLRSSFLHAKLDCSHGNRLNANRVLFMYWVSQKKSNRFDEGQRQESNQPKIIFEIILDSQIEDKYLVC